MRIEIGAAFRAADRQRGERVLEDLLEAEEFQDSDINGRMEAQAALVRSDRVIELDAEASLDMHLSCIVSPGDTEHDHSVRLHQSLEQSGVTVLFLACVNDRPDGFQHLGHSLNKFRLIGVFLSDGCEYFIDI